MIIIIIIIIMTKYNIPTVCSHKNAISDGGPFNIPGGWKDDNLSRTQSLHQENEVFPVGQVRSRFRS